VGIACVYVSSDTLPTRSSSPLSGLVDGIDLLADVSSMPYLNQLHIYCYDLRCWSHSHCCIVVLLSFMIRHKDIILVELSWICESFANMASPYQFPYLANSTTWDKFNPTCMRGLLSLVLHSCSSDQMVNNNTSPVRLPGTSTNLCKLCYDIY